MRPTTHAKQRIQGRLGEYVSEEEVTLACNKVPDNVDYAVVLVKALGKFVIVNEDLDTTKCSKGDEVVAVCRFGKIITVMLRKSWSTSNRY